MGAAGGGGGSGDEDMPCICFRGRLEAGIAIVIILTIIDNYNPQAVSLFMDSLMMVQSNSKHMMCTAQCRHTLLVQKQQS
jgi:hypothetical protein